MSDSNLLKVCQLNLFGDIMQTLIVPRVLYKSKEGLLFFFLEEMPLFLQQRPEKMQLYVCASHQW